MLDPSEDKSNAAPYSDPPPAPGWTQRTPGRFRNRNRIAKHEALQARARGLRSHGVTKARTMLLTHLGTFIAPAIPLAGCLTPRALRARRDAKAPGFEARA